MQIFETTDIKEFNDFLISQGASILQSWQWGDFQKKLGRKVWRLLLSSNVGKPLAAATIVKMPLPRGKCYLYAPRGPVIAPSPHLKKIWQLILDKLQDLAIGEKPIFFRIDPAIAGFGMSFRPEELGFVKIPWEAQPQTTQVLDISKTEADLLHTAKPKTRYNINLAQRKGITIERLTNSTKLKAFWELLQETSSRDGFSTYPYTYYLNLVEVLGKSNMAELILTSYHNRPLAGALTAYFGRQAIYLHGASSDRLRSLMAPYLVQWEGIMAAKAHDCTTYDFGGTAPAGSSNHPWAGITRFKSGFGGKEFRFVGAFDLPFDKRWYFVYKFARGLNRIF